MPDIIDNMPWLKNFTEKEQEHIKFVYFCATGEYKSQLSKEDLTIAKMIEMFNLIHYSLAPIGMGGEFAEQTKKRIAEIMEFREL